jgi:hypothetical protein
MKDSILTIAGRPADFASQDDEGLFAFINTLRLSVKAKVAAEQQHGLPLSEIVAQVREMVRAAERDTQHPKAFPAHAFRAISRQAVAWCIEAYRPLIIGEGNDYSAPPHELDSRSVPLTLAPAGRSSGRLPAQSPNSRGVP